jgi:hypothetical protein
VNDEIAIDNDVIAVAEDDSLNSNDEEAVASDVVEDDIVSEEPSNVVTNDTFYNYFDNTGTLLANVTSDELIFEGDFTGVGVSYMIINQSIKLTGKNAVFDGVSFVVDADNVTVDGFTLTLTNDVSLFTLYGVDDVTLSNNNLNFNAFDGFDSYAIYAFATTNLNIINNTITYVGSTDGTVVNNALRIEGDDDEDDPVPASYIVVAGNTF